jgi:4a-hydroxytetrahydrobiopterin dehydratase
LKLEQEQVEASMQSVPEWELEDKTIWRRYRFASFPEAVAFTNQVAEIAEAKNHHPFIAIDFKMVTLRLTSWHAGGLTEADFEEAAACDQIYESNG